MGVPVVADNWHSFPHTPILPEEPTMFAGPPIGAICPFAGQVASISSSVNTIWSNTPCASSGVAAGTNAEAPISYVEAQGWILCDGRYLKAAAYPELYAVLGGLYGERNSTADLEFRIPDYRGLFLRGFDAGAGMDPDAKRRLDPTGNNVANVVGSLQCDALQIHSHPYEITTPSGISQQGSAAGTSISSKSTGAPESPARTALETRPKNVAVNYLIKFR
ncbi:phage tail collar family protein [Rhizobium leguminosarum bv. viciae WSM1455]|uniref:tail fiber protein n=2 Tax=Rhizobium/Agrobacterium group TaxID=227290 RepID=UPI00027D70BD|nr:tail fiber protein [Rhizobium leguminosarum]EJC64811.1 phage tail collar family protein [Rhizobium leguminosarum bv. viciae WSM1455]MBY3186118.1 tail fiber protein [Rhizobium laguerreae]NKK99927.1 tail fiber protein [Rhizobium leguminosarum bv. viciae]MBY3561670.1 tail fiber protein [Rhizobium laguerreae]MBY5813629.1 tail fiber protein [Rhizobium leguminosarum]